MKAVPRVFTIAVFVIFCQASRGEIRTFVAEGRVNQITDPLGTLGFTHLGDFFSYGFAFDSNAPDLNGLPSMGIYDGISSKTMISGVFFPSGVPRIEINFPGDSFDAGSELAFPGSEQSAAGLRLIADPYTALSDALLPAEPYPLDLFTVTGLIATFQYPNPGGSSPFTAVILASVDSFYAIPEPFTLCLFAAAVCCLAHRRHP